MLRTLLHSRRRGWWLGLLAVGVSLPLGVRLAGDCEWRWWRFGRDLCLAERVAGIPADRPQDAVALAGTIEDDIVRGAAVDRWLRAHRASAALPAARPLCDLVPPSERQACGRRLEAAHLQR